MAANQKVLTYFITDFPIVFDIENDVALSQIKKHNQQFNYPHRYFLFVPVRGFRYLYSL